MKVWFSLIAVLILVAIAALGSSVSGLQTIFGIVIPYIAIATFLIGLILRVWTWAKSPVPFRITATCGQAKSLPWIKAQPLESPATGFQTFIRMFLEVVFFRSLFRNTKADLKDGRLVYGSSKWLWLGGIVFHYSFLVIILRHVNYFVTDTPIWVSYLQNVDGFLQIGLPVWYITDVTFVAAVTFLFIRRIWDSKLRFLSLMTDYFPLFLLLAIATSGILMRYWPGSKVDIVSVKALATSLFSFAPTLPEGIGGMFFIHLFLISSLLIYFPFSKLVHMAGVFMSPTRNLANNNRSKRHVNPWNYDVKTHTYEEYEDEFRPLMKAAGLPLEKDDTPQEKGE